jgi:hypothetical protein
MWITCGTRPQIIPKTVETAVETTAVKGLEAAIYKAFRMWIRKVLKP